MIGGHWVIRNGRHPKAEEFALTYRTAVEKLKEAQP